MAVSHLCRALQLCPLACASMSVHIRSTSGALVDPHLAQQSVHILPHPFTSYPKHSHPTQNHHITPKPTTPIHILPNPTTPIHILLKQTTPTRQPKWALQFNWSSSLAAPLTAASPPASLPKERKGKSDLYLCMLRVPSCRCTYQDRYLHTCLHTCLSTCPYAHPYTSLHTCLCTCL